MIDGITDEDLEISDFNVTDYIKNEDDILCYLNTVLENGDAGYLLIALQNCLNSRLAISNEFNSLKKDPLFLEKDNSLDKFLHIISILNLKIKFELK